MQAPAVERHAHRPATLDGGKCHQPGRLVAHGNRHPLAGAQAQRASQLPGQPVDSIEVVSEAQALLLPDDKFLVAMHPCRVNHLQQVARRLAEVTWAAIGQGHHFERRARGKQLLPGLSPKVNAHQGSPAAALRRRPRQGPHNVRNGSRDHPGRPGPPAPA
ncbi:hypothetical protein D9M71_700760 [compost metagenome]